MKDKLNNAKAPAREVILNALLVVLGVLAFKQSYVDTRFGLLPVWQILGVVAMTFPVCTIWNSKK